MNGLIVKQITKKNEDVLEKIWTENQLFVDGKHSNDVALGDMLFTKSLAESDGLTYYNNVVSTAFDWKWNIKAFPFELNLPKPIFRKLIYPLNQNELEAITRSTKKIEILKKDIENILSDDLTIKRLRSDSLDVSISYLYQTKQRLQVIDSLLNRTKDEFFLYKNRNQEGLNHWIQAVNAFDEVRGKIYESISANMPMLKNDVFFEDILDLLYSTQVDLLQYYGAINKVSIQLEKEDEQKNLETQMNFQYEKLLNIYQQQIGITNHIDNYWIKDFLQNKIKHYLQLTDYDEAKKYAGNILDKMTFFENIHAQTKDFDSLSDDLTSHFTLMVYNPYTGKNDIPMVAKKRALQNIKTRLLPWLNSHMIAIDNFDEFVSNWENQKIVKANILNFAHSESNQAKKLNKRLRKEKNPERMFKMLM